MNNFQRLLLLLLHIGLKSEEITCSNVLSFFDNGQIEKDLYNPEHGRNTADNSEELFKLEFDNNYENLLEEDGDSSQLGSYYNSLLVPAGDEQYLVDPSYENEDLYQSYKELGDSLANDLFQSNSNPNNELQELSTTLMQLLKTKNSIPLVTPNFKKPLEQQLFDEKSNHKNNGYRKDKVINFNNKLKKFLFHLTNNRKSRDLYNSNEVPAATNTLISSTEEQIRKQQQNLSVSPKLQQSNDKKQSQAFHKTTSSASYVQDSTLARPLETSWFVLPVLSNDVDNKNSRKEVKRGYRGSLLHLMSGKGYGTKGYIVQRKPQRQESGVANFRNNFNGDMG